MRTPEPERLDPAAPGRPAPPSTPEPRASSSSGASGSPTSATVACAAGIALHELVPQAGSLEELFLDWTSNDNTHLGGSDTAEVAETERQAVPL